MNRIHDLRVPLAQDTDDLTPLVARHLSLPPREIAEIRIIRKSLDARRKPRIQFVYTLDVRRLGEPAFEPAPAWQPDPVSGSIQLLHRPVVVGAGPAGLFAALYLAKGGFCPLLIDRGRKVEERIQQVNDFWQKGALDLESNACFGEGGAGTFSDGKLMTRIRNPHIPVMMDLLVAAGAPDEIRYLSHPHVGTDRLRGVLVNLRKQLLAWGGEVRYQTRLTGLSIREGKLKGIMVNQGEAIATETLVLAIGHSARDTYEMLLHSGVTMEAKSFAVGLRIEHLQEQIDEMQYGVSAGHPRLPPAEYQLAVHGTRPVYTFCMCPGGAVIGTATEPDGLSVNGMSMHDRGSFVANSALVVAVEAKDLEGHHPLRGMDYQRTWEQKAFQLGGGGFYAPVQTVGDFLHGRSTTGISQMLIRPSYRPGVHETDLKACLPQPVADALITGIRQMDEKMNGFAHPAAWLTGVETRTSAPVRITRDASRQSVSVSGLFPVGEGAGYAGGIVSAAVDGMDTAAEISRRFIPTR